MPERYGSRALLDGIQRARLKYLIEGPGRNHGLMFNLARWMPSKRAREPYRSWQAFLRRAYCNRRPLPIGENQCIETPAAWAADRRTNVAQILGVRHPRAMSWVSVE